MTSCHLWTVLFLIIYNFYNHEALLKNFMKFILNSKVFESTETSKTSLLTWVLNDWLTTMIFMWSRINSKG